MIVLQKKLEWSKFKLAVSAEVMMNQMIDLMLQQILRTVLAAFWYPRIPEGIPVLVQVDVVRNEGVQVRDGVKQARDLDFMDSALGVTLATKACIVS